MKQHFMMFAAYNRWANEQVYTAAAALTPDELARDLGAFFKSVIGTLNHILAADRIWLRRFTGEGDAPASLDATLSADFETLLKLRKTEDERIMAFVDGLDDHKLKGRFTYMTVTDMRTVSQRLAPALDHFFNHQTHHRGQLHMALTSLGKPSLTLDLIYFQRTEEGRQFA